MARYGVIADIHGNFEALSAALAFLERADVDRIVCCGDVVGYNADGDRCVETLVARGVDTIAGNHDLIAVGRLGTERCWYKAAHALERTRRALSDDSRRFLAGLPAERRYEERLLLIHGGLGDPTRYLRSTRAVREDALRLMQRDPAIRYCMFGHTHDPIIYRVSPAGDVEALAGSGERRLDDSFLHFINPGSIDAARKDGYGHAELAIVDTERARVRFERLPYDAERAERKARLGGYRPSRVDELRYRALRQVARVRRYMDRRGSKTPPAIQGD